MPRDHRDEVDGHPGTLAAEADRAWQAGDAAAAAQLRLQTLRALLAVMHDLRPALDDLDLDVADEVHQREDAVVELLIMPGAWPVSDAVGDVVGAHAWALGVESDCGAAGAAG